MNQETVFWKSLNDSHSHLQGGGCHFSWNTFSHSGSKFQKKTCHHDIQTVKKKKIKRGQLFSTQVSISLNILVSSNALLNLKMAIIKQYTLGKLLFIPDLNWFSEIHRKLEWQAKKKRMERKGGSILI